ncbi:YbaB/EbfC family nucleoid-associated protein [Couchioplanes caeruleus]|uniref:YbaB/EbfC family nucleoid-associated protein n=1 Tax=Couchioplanes caeruleus TaxID=56438 RepID=UPI0020BDB3BE|nr:YbaB/EbfC family nucleoid-associated protein [Couchioplanes caeruleus]UQU67838.1 YbaB/EbfC family nucleoid-associated protein [Couchioplanes caeruleus]
MFHGHDFDAAERIVDGWQEGFERRAARAHDLAGRIGELQASARSADGLVEVTVGSTGELLDLHLDEDVRRLPATQITQRIMVAARAARAELLKKVTVAVDDTVGADTESGRAILAGYRTVDTGRGL